MLSEMQNHEITQVGPGTPGGQLMRSYWQPIALSRQLEQQNPRPVRILGETLALFRNGSGKLGLVDDHCAHRRTSLSTGCPEMHTLGRVTANGLRCIYHGWLYAPDGQCLEQPGEPQGSRYFEKIKIKSYPVEEKYGFFWAYMGEGEPPVIPPFDVFARTDGYRINSIGEWSCNYLQCVENVVDPVHVPLLHVKTGFDNEKFNIMPTVRAEVTRFGLKTIAGRPGYERETECLLPNGVRVAVPVMDPGIMLIFILVPMDDERTLSFNTWFIPLPDDMPQEERQAKMQELDQFVYELGANDKVFHALTIDEQDKFAAGSQGAIMDRSKEHLGSSDVGIVMLRRLLREGIHDVQNGREPRGLIREQQDEIVHFSNVF